MFGPLQIWLLDRRPAQRAAIADILTTLAKLFLAVGLVGPFFRQAGIGTVAAIGSVAFGVALFLLALLILAVEDPSDGL